MKDLITIFAHCPDFNRKKILQDLIVLLQEKRNDYDIMVVSHSSISDFSFEMIDYFYYDRNNHLIREFELTNKFWFNGEGLKVNSSLVYPFSTHLAIYRLLYFTINFAKSMRYEKVHFIEYDIIIQDLRLIDFVNSRLDEFDNIMFRGDDGWIWGTYFASNLNTIDYKDFIYNEKEIIEMLSGEESRMTENITHKILSKNFRTILFESIDKIDSNRVCQKNDEHINYHLKWCVPVVNKENNELNFFIFNEKGGSYVVDIFVDNECKTFITQDMGTWSLVPIGNINNVNKLEIFVDKKIRNTIILDDNNKENFKNNNFFYFE